MFRLLIVDDHPAQVESLAQTANSFAELPPVGIVKAFSGFEALEQIKAQSVDIVITDIRMPGMSGLQLIEAIRAAVPEPPKFIILSGYADFEYAKQAIQYQITRYLMKPVDTEELRSLLRECTAEISASRERQKLYQQSVYTLREHYPLLRGYLLRDLTAGQRLSRDALAKKLKHLELPFEYGHAVCMMFVRLEEGFAEYTPADLSLLEYALENMAGEIFAREFAVWSFKDIHEYIVFLIKPIAGPQPGDEGAAESLLARAELAAQRLKGNVRHYLKGRISVLLLRKWVSFPEGLPQVYRLGTAALPQRIGEGKELFVSVEDEFRPAEIDSIQSLHEPPHLIHLLEAGRWDAVMERMDRIFRELSGKWNDSPEYLNEAFYVFASAFNYISHRNGRQLSEMGSPARLNPAQASPFQTLRQLKEWAYHVVELIRNDLRCGSNESRRYIVDRVTGYIHRHLGRDVSLQTIADRVGLHPVYLSRLFKMEKGISVSDYIMQCRMERAAELLKDKKLKIYHIANLLGYQTSHYFIKVFKKFYGLTPQEFKSSCL